MMRRLFGPIAATAFLSGCSSAPVEAEGRVEVAQSAVQAGSEVVAPSPAVAICSMDATGVCVFRCSGTLIAPNLVLTVRHCIQHVTADRPDCEKDVFTTPIGPPGQFWIVTSARVSASPVGNPSGFHQVRYFFPNPNQRGVCGADLALLLLKDSVPPTEATLATPVLDGSVQERLTATREIAVVGYGDTGVATSDRGVRRIREGVRVSCVGSEACPHTTSSFLRDREFVVGEGVCEGDSGSPAFDQAEFRRGNPMQLGLLSRGMSSGTRCTEGIYQRLDAWADLVAGAGKQAALIGEYPAPAWAENARLVVPGPSSAFAPGELGGECTQTSDCRVGFCASSDNGIRWSCTQSCKRGDPTQSCPNGLQCLEDGDLGLCFPYEPQPRGAVCTMSASQGAEDAMSSAFVALVMPCIALLRRLLKRAGSTASSPRCYSRPQSERRG